MKAIIFAVLLASSAAFAAHPHATPHRVHYQWRIVDLMQDGRFRFQGSDNVSYFYSVDGGTANNHFVSGPTTSDDGVYFLPQGGSWSHGGSGLDQTGVVVEEERTIVYFDNKGSPADGQHPPAEDTGSDTN